MGKKSKLKQHVTNKRKGKLKLYYHDEGYKDLTGNFYTKQEGLEMLQQKKATLPKWKKGKKQKTTYEGTEYRGGRVSGRKNLIKLEGGKVQNQHGVVFTEEEKKALERQVNRANRTRMKMLEEEGNLERHVEGKPTGQKVSTLQNMGKESDFIISRKSKSLQGFKTKQINQLFMLVHI